MVVPSNHDDFIDRYITQRKFVYDEENIVLACKLFVALAEGHNAIEWWLKKEAKINTKNIKFLEIDKSSEIGGVELNVHGHIGSNGAKGSPASLETAYGSCVTGHSHAPQIFREVYTVGCNCKLRQDYNKGGSSWLHGNCIVYKGGVRQMIIIVDGAY